jgi:hypothetical protein
MPRRSTIISTIFRANDAYMRPNFVSATFCGAKAFDCIYGTTKILRNATKKECFFEQNQISNSEGLKHFNFRDPSIHGMDILKRFL